MWDIAIYGTGWYYSFDMGANAELVTAVSQAHRNRPGLRLRFSESRNGTSKLELTSNGTSVKLLAEIKSTLTDASIGAAAIRSQRSGERIAVVTRYVTPSQAEKLKNLGITYFDAAGNGYVNEKGVYIEISGKKAPKVLEKPTDILNAAGIKAILAFINRPGFESTDYRTIATEIGIPKTSLGRLMNDLEHTGYLRGSGRNRHLVNKSDLVRRWCDGYIEGFRPKLDPIRFTSTKFKGRWWDKIDITEYKAVWGGEPAGARLTKFLKPAAATIYADSNLTLLQARYGLVRDNAGELTILKRFWTFGEVKDCAPPLVVYADLLRTADGRNIETAQMIYDTYIAPLIEAAA